MFKSSVKLRRDLYDRAKKNAGIAGYSSVEEFIEHIIEKELAKIEEDARSDEDVLNKLKGLGYID